MGGGSFFMGTIAKIIITMIRLKLGLKNMKLVAHPRQQKPISSELRWYGLDGTYRLAP